MSDNPRLLVVDDDAVICQACRRVFTPQGFRVEQCTDARRGLSQATHGDYAAILLDIKMPQMDGIEFLEALRWEKPSVPVIFITAYPSISTATSAVHLGISDYITKPFTPEQITRSVQRVLPRHHAETMVETDSTSLEAGPWFPQAGEFRFWNESWFQLGKEGRVRAGAMHQRIPSTPMSFEGAMRVGAVLARPQTTSGKEVRLPQAGEVVYQGLPLAGLILADDSLVIIPSPVSGVVVSVNELLRKDPSRLLTDPCGKGWIACICATRLEEEKNRCRPRHVVLVNSNLLSARDQLEQLTSLGCQIHVVKDGDELALSIQDRNYEVLLFDAASFGDVGPELVRRVNVASPSLKVVVIGSSGSHWETAYREHKLFYYAVEPFVDNEIVDILNAVFRTPTPFLLQPERQKASIAPIGALSIINRHGHRVQLLAAPGLLRENDGLGGQIRQKLTARTFPTRITLGDVDVTPSGVMKTASTCNRVIVLLATDTGRLPGSLAQDTKAQYVSASGVCASNVTTLVVQPGSNSHGLAGLDERTIAVLAEHIVWEMVS